ncbi:MAG: ABC transporter ATP-binding protein [Velocimicrobium sp.]
MIQKILEVQSLLKYYGKQNNVTKALNGLSFQVVDGEYIGIMGSSGSGKTTLLNCIATTIRPTEGKILLKGKNICDFKGKKLADYRGSHIGYLFQNFELLDNLTGRENIMLPMAIHNVINQEKNNRIAELAQYLEIEDVLSKFPPEMSGGQKQRVAAARALILNPEIVLADEPTGALDSKNAKSLMDKLSGLNQEKKATILMVTHDPNAASYCSRILFIQDGMIFHELRRKLPEESQHVFYERIIAVMTQLAGGSANVL